MITATTQETISNALRTVAINGAYNASRALSKWLKRGVRLTTEGFESVPLAQVTTLLGDPEESIAAIHLPLTGDVSGHMLLTFPEKVALSIVDIMLQQPCGTATEFTELEQSCLCETGNIVCSAYANSLSKWLKLHIEPDVPRFTHDMACAVIEPLLMEVMNDQDSLFMTVTDFLLDKQKLQWGMLLIPSEDSLKAMEGQSTVDTVRQEALQTIAVNGAFNASRAVSKWLKRGVKISTHGFTRVPLRDISSVFPDSTPIAALHMELGEQMRGHCLIGIPENDALKLVDMLLGQSIGTCTQITELEESCLQETANIIASSFVNSWSTWLDIHVEPAAPRFIIDLPEAILETIVTEQALVSDEIFLAKTDFMVDGQWLEWVFLLLPAPSAMRMIESSKS